MFPDLNEAKLKWGKWKPLKHGLGLRLSLLGDNFMDIPYYFYTIWLSFALDSILKCGNERKKKNTRIKQGSSMKMTGKQ